WLPLAPGKLNAVESTVPGGAKPHASTGTPMLGSQIQFPFVTGPAPVVFGAARLTFEQLSAKACPAVIANDATTIDVVIRKRLIPSPLCVMVAKLPTISHAGETE